MAHCPLSGCHLLRDIISRGKKQSRQTYHQSVYWGTFIFFLFHYKYLFCVCDTFFPSFSNVQLQLSSFSCFFLSRVWGGHISHIKSFIESRNRYVCRVPLLVYSYSCKLTILVFPPCKIQIQILKTKLYNKNGKILNVSVKLKNVNGFGLVPNCSLQCKYCIKGPPEYSAHL